MTRTCPNCGSRAIDEQSQFCNKCGTPFPASDQPTKVFVRTTPRPATTPPPPPVQQPVAAPEYYPPPQENKPSVVPQARYPPSDTSRPQVPARKPPVRRQSVSEKPLIFKKVIARDYPKLVYWLGVIAILFIVVAGITSDQSKTTKASGSSSDSSAASDTKSSDDLFATLPLFWIGVFLIAILAWRVLCETGVAVYSLRDPVFTGSIGSGIDNCSDDDRISGYSGALMGESIECPRCGKIVSADDTRTCEICGTPGCTSCIRLMGLLKKKWTCRDCFERK